MKTRSERKKRHVEFEFPFDHGAHDFTELFLEFAHHYRHPRQEARLAEFLTDWYHDLIRLGAGLAKLADPKADEKAEARAKAKPVSRWKARLQ